MATETGTKTHEAAESAKAQAQNAWDDTKERARTAIDEQQHAAAEGIGQFAGALRDAAHHVDGGEEAMVARAASIVADGLDRVSGTLRSKSVDGLVHDIESFARQQPLAFFGAALATGFVAVRFLKSREPLGGRVGPRDGDPHPGERYGSAPGGNRAYPSGATPSPQVPASGLPATGGTGSTTSPSSR